MNRAVLAVVASIVALIAAVTGTFAQAPKSPCDWTKTRKRMFACEAPQNSAHCPR